ncbi:hypothetical protein L218DRAFT_852577, partial [Marasmius fiardii PR-910]
LLAALPSCSQTSDTEYDYVIVGAGAGGGPLAARLVEAGYSESDLTWCKVLVLDTGHDVDNFNTTIPAYFIRAAEDPQIELSYTLNEYPVGFPIQKNDQWYMFRYPRARGIGGSTIHNAMFNIIANTRPELDGLARMFNDSTWSRDNMQSIFKRIEHNLYLGLPKFWEHGFQGWLKTSVNPILDVLNPKYLGKSVRLP